MIEALPVLFIAAVATAAYVGARRCAADPSPRSVAAETRRLRARHVWLAERLLQSKRERWDQEMQDRLIAEIELIVMELAVIESTAARVP